MKKSIKILSIIIILTIFLITIIVIKNNKLSFTKYTLPTDIKVIDCINSSNFYVEKKGQSGIYNFNLKTKSLDPFFMPDTLNSVCKDYFVWIEKDANCYYIITQDILDGNKEIVDKYETKVEPFIELDKNKNLLLYSKLNGDYIEIIFKDLNTNTSKSLDRKNINDPSLISNVSISNKYIVWSKHTGDLNNINSSIYLYDIESGLKQTIANNCNMVKPMIKNNILIATKFKKNLNYTESILVKYNFSNSTWSDFISTESNLYKNLKNVSIDDPIIGEKYLSWWDNWSNNIHIYNINKNKFLSLYKNDTEVIKQVYFIKDRLIFYRELVDGKNYHKLIIIN
ncbi:hypothetical protein DP129_00995 [Clostridium tetani]|uniref:hypothetical protein n=1 Tax=Clostridium tetani TaxID=1513 RepID=UPI00100B2C7F|nr:hypothetical protein [Clostridium tetani]RXI41551.1 hypothetical protein DP129_00995 [Clostridium tetani]